MLCSIFSAIHSSYCSSSSQFTPPLTQSKRSAFHHLASLQLAVRTPSTDPDVEPAVITEKAASSGDYLATTNSAMLRSQGKLCLTFALSSHSSGSNAEKIRIVNELEACVDGAFLEEDYRRRIYLLGGILAGDKEIWEGLRSGGRSMVEQLAVGRV
jgi:hypothetical protein